MSEADEFRELKEEINRRAEYVNDEIESVLPLGRPRPLYEASRYLFEAGGKRLRPVILLLVTEALGREEGDYDGVLSAAISMEIVHSFTLIHDDIMDDDSLRRGVPSVHVKWDESTAILAGDTLYSKAFEIMLESDASAEEMNRLLALLAETCTHICEGQAMDVDFEEMDRVSEDEYLEMVEKKTAILFAASASIGAILSGADDETVDRMYDYGIKIGKAFQIHDDILDLTASSEKLGKKRASDLAEDKRTLINIHAREHGVEVALPEDATEEEIEAKVAELEEAGSIEYARQMAHELVEDGKKDLEVLPDSDAKEVLKQIADFLVERDH